MQINVLEYLEKSVEKYPEKEAFEDTNITETFKSFRDKAMNLSSNFITFNNSKKQPVAVFLPKSVNALISFVGIMYSGNIYVPLDIKSPPERLEGILNNISPIAVITDSTNAKKLEQLYDNSKILIFDELISEAKEQKTNYEKLIDTDGAYIINTSGSTGIPKGVLISHRSIIDYIEWATECYDISDKEIIGNQAPFYFDNSVLDIYLCLKNGAKLIITPEEYFVFPIQLLTYYKEKKVNMFFFVPSVMVNIANMNLLENVKPDFTKILFAGEVMPTKQLNYWIKNYPNALFSNLYGPTEITVDCTYYTVNRKFRDDEPLPIGNECRNSNVLVLDEENNLVTEPNKQGELCVRGSSLALGYYNDFEKTNSVFVQNPLNTKYPEKIYRTGDIVYYNERGEIIFQGRKDSQIKHMGYRIELGEIEAALGGMKELTNICVLYNSIHSRIVLFYEAKNEIQKKDLIINLSKTLPKYMIPTELHKLDRLPTNSNGKIDRLALKKLIEEENLCVK